MNTLEINKLAKSNPTIAPVFGGCLASDQLANLLQLQGDQLPIAFVINLCDSSIVGNDSINCHWVALYMDDKRQIDFLDTSGEQSFNSNKYIRQFIKRQFVKNITFNTKQIQSLLSNKCGLFCLCFINARSSNISYHKFASAFDMHDLTKNDEIVQSMFAIAFATTNTNCKCNKETRKQRQIKKKRYGDNCE